MRKEKSMTLYQRSKTPKELIIEERQRPHSLRRIYGRGVDPKTIKPWLDELTGGSIEGGTRYVVTDTDIVDEEEYLKPKETLYEDGHVFSWDAVEDWILELWDRGEFGRAEFLFCVLNELERKGQQEWVS